MLFLNLIPEFSLAQQKHTVWTGPNNLAQLWKKKASDISLCYNLQIPLK